MSGLLEHIVRRRRASASSRLGPPPQNELPYGVGDPELAGATHAEGRQDPDREGYADGHALPDGQRYAEDPYSEAEPYADPEPGANGGSPSSPGSESVQHEAAEHARAQFEPEVRFEPEAHSESEAPAQPWAQDDPQPQVETVSGVEPGFRERGRLRRRARYLRRLREVQLRDIGGLMLELNRFDRQRPELVHAKVEGVASTDRELRALGQALGEPQPLRALREAGIGGACGRCGAVHGSGDRFCAACGEPLSAREYMSERAPELRRNAR